MKKALTRIAVPFRLLADVNELAVDYLARGLSAFMRRGGLVVILAIAIAGVTYTVHASRNSAGTYSPTAGIPVVTHSVISATTFNNLIADIGAEITSSVDKAGRTVMTAQLPLYNCTSTSPSFGFASETTAGIYRSASGDFRWAFNGTDALKIHSSNGITAVKGLVSPLGIGNTSATYPLDVGAVVGATAARFSSSTNYPGSIIVHPTTFGLLANVTHDGSNFKYITTNPAVAQDFETTNGPTVAWYTAPSGTAGNSATMTERLRVSATGTTFSTGIGADGSGFKHKRGTGGCTTAAVAGAVCTTTVTWTTAFADTNYTAVCVGRVVGTGSPVISHIATVNAGSVVVDTMAVVGVASAFTNVDCVGVHD